MVLSGLGRGRGKGRKAKENIGRLTFSLGAAPKRGRRISRHPHSGCGSASTSDTLDVSCT